MLAGCSKPDPSGVLTATVKPLGTAFALLPARLSRQLHVNDLAIDGSRHRQKFAICGQRKHITLTVLNGTSGKTLDDDVLTVGAATLSTTREDDES
jgi:hypothetical protein